ncbi:MAG: dienelactone hydrolase family protein [Pseudolysinimonas sp.]
MAELVPIPSPGVPLAYGAMGAPIVVVLHDKYGRLPWLEPYAEALANRGGLRVLVPDFYDGVATTESEGASALMAALTDEAAAGILGETIAAERGEGIDAQRIGLVGFSMGGGIALRGAQAGLADAVVAYYATLGPADPGIVPCPVLLHLAEEDSWSAGADPDSFAARLRDDGTPVTAHTYLGTLHSFANATLREKVDGRAAALAFARTTVFLESRLKD